MDILRVGLSIFLAWLGLLLSAVTWAFPYRTDAPQTATFRPDDSAQRFYNLSYAEQKREMQYVGFARSAAKAHNVPETVGEFISRYQLQDAHILEIGAGSGLLQDEVQDYTGLDISATASRFFHKPFVQADARSMPFRDGEFDAVWSIWVLEHVPNPEQALREMRRVVKPNGLLFLMPTWLCSPLSAQGYHIRHYTDLGVIGGAMKASGLITEAPLFRAVTLISIRALRRAALTVPHQSSLHYRALTPNYDHYWEPDSDAVNSLDAYEAYLWFKSRGDVCLNCDEKEMVWTGYEKPLIVRIKPTR